MDFSNSFSACVVDISIHVFLSYIGNIYWFFVIKIVN